MWPDWSVLSTYVALNTSTIRILTSLVVPYRPLLAVAKQIATIDSVSDGRFTLAAAVGWLRREFEMLGISYEDRGAITDEYLRAMKVLWTEDDPCFSGRHVSFSDIVFEPKCTQSPHVPIWIAGGGGTGPIRRLLELGDGWMPMGGGLDDNLRETVARIKDRAFEAGRDPNAITFRYTIGVGTPNAELQTISKSISVDDPAAVGNDGTPESISAEIARFEEAGFNELAINFSGESAPEVLEQLDWFGAEVMPRL
jgi:probable F420-dependent oxidoreductase